MIIRVGAKNKNKIQAVERAVAMLTSWEATFKGISVPSGVSEEPRSLEETVAGAINRAKMAFQEGTAYSVGLEDGMLVLPQSNTGFLNFCACAVFDGKTVHIGFSPAYEHPDSVAPLLFEEKIGLNAAYYKAGLTKEKNLGATHGVSGVLTNNIITREDYMVPGIAMALAHLLNS